MTSWNYLPEHGLPPKGEDCWVTLLRNGKLEVLEGFIQSNGDWAVDLSDDGFFRPRRESDGDYQVIAWILQTTAPEPFDGEVKQ